MDGAKKEKDDDTLASFSLSHAPLSVSATSPSLPSSSSSTSASEEELVPTSLANKSFTADLRLDCTKAKYADIVKRAIGVEPELRPSMIIRVVNNDEDGILHIRFEAVDLKSLRASIGSILELVQVSMQTINELAPQTPIE